MKQKHTPVSSDENQDENNTFPVVIEQGNTEFVLVGGAFQNHGILMISSHASAELIGADPSDKGGAEYGSIKTVLGDWRGALGLSRVHWATSNVIGSDSAKRIRGNTITIIWKGYSTKSMMKSVKEILDIQAYDILESLKSGDLWDQIKAIGPVLSRCKMRFE